MLGLDNPRKILVDSGRIQGQTFIERYEKAVSANAQIFSLGRGTRFQFLFPKKSIRVISFSCELDKLLQVIICLFLGYKSLSLYPRVLIYALKGSTNREKVRRLYKGSIVLFIKPHIVHLQWVENLKDWEWIIDTNVKLTVSLRGSQVNIRPLLDPSIKHFYSVVFPKVDRFHAVSIDIAQISNELGARKDSIRIIYSGLELSEYQFFDRPSSECLKIVSVGRSHWVKGFDYSLKAVKMLNDRGVNFRYTIIGGSHSDELAFLVDEYKLQDKVFLKDEMNHSAMKSFLSKCDILVLPSVSEGIANVAIEAMALGTMVISTDVGGMKELIQHGETGFLVQMRDPIALCECIRHVYKMQSLEKSRIKFNARINVERRFNFDLMAEDFNEFYSF